MLNESKWRRGLIQFCHITFRCFAFAIRDNVTRCLNEAGKRQSQFFEVGRVGLFRHLGLVPSGSNSTPGGSHLRVLSAHQVCDV